MSLEAGQIIDGKYRIIRELGSGGMGAVYEGENTRIHRRVAIKVLHAGVAAKADVVQRFEREAQAAGRIGSEHIVEVLDLGNLPGGERYMVMEFLEGENLGDRIKVRGRIDPREIAPIAWQLLEGLAAAHDTGIIHRDLKPDNVFLVAGRMGREFVKVLDFGVSKFSALDADSMSMTRTGAVMGTPYYMSPEQARGSKIDIRSDLYSVGVVLYQAVTGRVPFNAETFNELVFKIALESPHPAELVTPGLDPGFATIIARAMVRDPAGRFQSAREFQGALANWINTGQGVGPAAPGAYPNPPTGGGAVAPAGGMQGSQFGFTPSGVHGHQGMPAGGHSGSSFGAAPQAIGAPGGSMAQSSLQFAASQPGVAVTPSPSRGSGTMIAIGLAATLLMAGGGFGAYKVMSKPAQPAPAASASAPVAAAEPAATASAAPSAAPTAAAESEPPAPTASASASATAEAPPAATSTAAATTASTPRTTKTPSKTPSGSAPPAGSKPAGRVIGGEL